MDDKSTKKPLQILLTASEREELESAAGKASVPLGTYIRMRALESARAAK